MARARSSHDASTHLFLLLLLLPAGTKATATATPYSSRCDYPIAAPDRELTGTLMLPGIPTGHFSGGRGLGFGPDPDDRSHVERSFYYSHLPARPTANPAVIHVFATLILEGTRLVSGGYLRPHSVSFNLEGYFSTATATATAELCMVGSGSYAKEDGSGVVLLSGVTLRLHLPHPSNLSRPFVTGLLEGHQFRDVTLVGYASSYYEYGQAASCPPPPVAVRGEEQVLRLQAGPIRAKNRFPCHRLRALLQTSYSLEYMAAAGNVGSSRLLRLRHRRMYVNRMDCDRDGAVRAYMVFYTNHSDSGALPSHYTPRWRQDSWIEEDDEDASNRWGVRRRNEDPLFLVGDEALVADGFWDASRSQLCLRACRVASSGQSGADLAVGECGIGVRFWFPAVWSIRDRSVAAGMIRNTGSGGDDTAGVISVSRTRSYMGNLSGIEYNYTRVEEAKKHYNSMPELSKERKGRFPGNYSYRDFTFGFFLNKRGLRFHGHALPVTIGSAFVGGDGLMADEAFSLHGAAEMNKQRLLNVSYDLQYRLSRFAYGNYSYSPPNSPQPRLRRKRISAEGVYDTETGSLCMVACQAVVNGSSDCEILVTVQFPPMDAVARDRAVGTIRSLREQGDPLFFEALGFAGHGGMYAEQAAESSSRMDMESIMLVASMTLSCVFTALQLRHVKKHPEALPATSTAMLVVLALGYVIPLVLNLEDMYEDSRRRFFFQLTSGGSLELNELMLRASTVLAFVLQLRLLQLSLSSRGSPTDPAGGKHDDSPSSSDAERSTLWICLPLYALGAVVVWIVHMSDDHHGLLAGDALLSPRRPALVDDLAAYAGLILDGFLLPQVVSNALSGSRVRALSAWFYGGSTVIRAAPHVYDVFRRQNYVPSWRTSYVYANPRDDIFGVAWDVAIPCGAVVLAVVLFLQQRLGGAFVWCFNSRRSGE